MSLYKKTKNTRNTTKKIVMVAMLLFLIGILVIATNPEMGNIFISKNDLAKTNQTGSFSVKIIVAENFGESTIFSKEIEIKYGESAMDVLNKVSNVTHSYGGGFVESINGIKSTYLEGKEEKKDWFYYINGMLSPVGASQYILQPGDVERWDFHNSWDADRITTAIIGDYPEPFAHGFQGHVRNTTIVYSDEFYDNACELQQSLKQHDIIASINLFEDLSNGEKMNNNLILIDTYDNNLIEELNTNARSLGLFIEFEEGKLTTFTKTGEEDHVFDTGGVIFATKNHWNPKGNWNSENVVWVISGVTNENVTEAVEILVNNYNDIKNYASLVTFDETIYKVP